MTTSFTPQYYDLDAIVRCDDCDYTCYAHETGPILEPEERLAAGDPLPAGECPKCGCLAYLDEDDTSEESKKEYTGIERHHLYELLGWWGVEGSESTGVTLADALRAFDAKTGKLKLHDFEK